MDNPKQPNEVHRIVVVGAEDVAQYLRKEGHRVLFFEHIPSHGEPGAHVVIVELDGTNDARAAMECRSRFVEPILIHRRERDRAKYALSIRRKPSGEIGFDLLMQTIRHVLERTRLMIRLQEEDCDSEAATSRVTQKFPVRPLEIAGEMTTMARRPRRTAGERK